MKARVFLGPLAPFLCARCKRVLWWTVVYGDAKPVLIDARGREHCAPLVRFPRSPHRMPRVDRVPR